MTSRSISIIFISVLFLSISCGNDKFIVTIDNQYEIVDQEKVVVLQTTRTLTLDSLPIAVLTKIMNYNNDSRIEFLTGLRKDDGLQNYMLDSIYYDSASNDTLKKSFIYNGQDWHLTQNFHKKFRFDKQIYYFMTERQNVNERYYKKEIFYRFNSDSKLISETEFECNGKTECDSTTRKEFFYSSIGNLDSTVFYVWKNNEWARFVK